MTRYPAPKYSQNWYLPITGQRKNTSKTKQETINYDENKMNWNNSMLLSVTGVITIVFRFFGKILNLLPGKNIKAGERHPLFSSQFVIWTAAKILPQSNMQRQVKRMGLDANGWSINILVLVTTSDWQRSFQTRPTLANLKDIICALKMTLLTNNCCTQVDPIWA